jgi:hypothetical protein
MDQEPYLGLRLDLGSSEPNWIKFESVIGELFRELQSFDQDEYKFHRLCGINTDSECFASFLRWRKSEKSFYRLAPRLWPPYPDRSSAWWLLDATSARQPLYPQDLYYHNGEDRATYVSLESLLLLSLITTAGFGATGCE